MKILYAIGLIYTAFCYQSHLRHALKSVHFIKTLFRKLASYTSKIKRTTTDRVAFIGIPIFAFMVIAFLGSTVHFQEGGVFDFLGQKYEIGAAQASESSLGLLSGVYSVSPADTTLTTLNGTTLLAGLTLEQAVLEFQENREPVVPIDRIITHAVEEGETLSEIATTYDIDVPTIMVANKLRNANSLRLGQELLILPTKGILYTVASGDTVSAIAHTYGITADDIIEYNKLPESGDLYIGERLILSGAVQPINRSTVVRSKLPLQKVTSGGGGAFIIPVNGIQTQYKHGTYGAIDVAANIGTPIYASAAGTVEKAPVSGWHGGYGLYVQIKHPNGCKTTYAHNSKVYVTPGQTVAQGELIAAVGSTGRSTGPHVHFEVRGGCINPLW